MFMGKAGACPKEEGLNGAHLGRFQPCLQTVDKAGKACQVKTLKLITKLCKF
jgi:hypothetical protein